MTPRKHWRAPALTAAVILAVASCGDSEQPAISAAAGQSGSPADSGGGGSAAEAGSSPASSGAPPDASGAAGMSGGAAPGSAGTHGGSDHEAGAGGWSGWGWGGESNSGGWGDGCLVGQPSIDVAEGGAAGAAPVLLGELGAECSDWGSLACAGADQRQSLVCQLGVWEVLQQCSEQERCDQQNGRCHAVLPGCVDQEPGHAYCEGDVLQVCGPDRVTAKAFPCCGRCSDGECLAPRCGDGQRALGEECDDGNRQSGDGCDSDCRPSGVVQLVGGQRHTCALLREGRVRCWGGNDEGQLGLADTAEHGAQHPFELGLVPLGAPAVELAAGSRHTCARLRGGAVRCWGANEHGQLGLGHRKTIGDDEPPSASHATVSLGPPARSLSAGGESTCALLDDGRVRCWGRNDWGQLGTALEEDIGDDELPSSHEVELNGVAAQAACTSGEHSCVALKDGTFRCWGYNEFEQLDFMNQWSLSSGGVRGLFGSGFRTYTWLTWDQGGDYLFAAGFNLDGLLGVGGPSPVQAPSDAASLRTLYATEQVATGPTHVCYVQSDQTLHCFGANDEGQLGFPDTTDRYRPYAVDLGQDAEENPLWPRLVGAGEAHTCVWLATQELRCWGRNDSGQLGLGYVSPAPHDHVGGSSADNAITATSVQLFGSN